MAVKLTTENSGGFGPVPAGNYQVVLDNLSVIDTKAGDAKMWKVVYKIISEESKGRLVFDNVVLKDACVGFVGRFVDAMLGTIENMEMDQEAGIVTQDSIPLKPTEFIGTQLCIQVGVRKTDRGEFNDVKSYAAADSVISEDAPAGTPF